MTSRLLVNGCTRLEQPASVYSLYTRYFLRAAELITSGLNIVDQSLQCPDMNPMENLWDELERNVRKTPHTLRIKMWGDDCKKNGKTKCLWNSCYKTAVDVQIIKFLWFPLFGLIMYFVPKVWEFKFIWFQVNFKMFIFWD